MNSMQLKAKIKIYQKKKILILIRYLDYICMIDF